MIVQKKVMYGKKNKQRLGDKKKQSSRDKILSSVDDDDHVKRKQLCSAVCALEV